VVRKTYAQLLAAHVQDHQKLFRRAELDLGTTLNAALPTDERISKFHESKDPQLATLLFQYGRYLLIASSRRGRSRRICRAFGTRDASAVERQLDVEH